MGYKRTVEPEDEDLLPLGTIKEACRVTHSVDDAFLGTLRQGAREYCEDYTGRALMPQTWQRVMDRFPFNRELILRYPPLVSVTSITYIDPDGASQTMSSSDYIVDTFSYRGRIALAPGASWPATQCDRINAVTVTYVAGYADEDAVPQKLKQGMLMLIAHHYDKRSPIIVGSIQAELAFSLKALWDTVVVPDWDED